MILTYVCYHTGACLASESGRVLFINRVGQSRIYTQYMTVNLVITLPKIPYTHRIYMVLANLRYMVVSGHIVTHV